MSSTLQKKHDFVEPILKWPGGKRWLSSLLADLIRNELENCYYEPFVGGGAIFLAVNPPKAILSDINDQLIDFYRTCVKIPNEVVTRARRFSNVEEDYYVARSSRPRTPAGKAGRFLYLNRTCWGGIFRLNRQGEFNVPFGDSGRVICCRKAVCDAANRFKAAEFLCRDFSEAFEEAQAGDVVFADPPYTSRGQFNGFVRYNENKFSWEDQVRVSVSARSARNRGAFVIVCGSFHREVLALYRNWWAVEIRRSSLVARDPDARRKVSECLMISRKPKLIPAEMNRITDCFISSIPYYGD